MCLLWGSGQDSFIIDKVERVESNGVCGQHLVVDNTVELHLDNKLGGGRGEREREGGEGRMDSVDGERRRERERSKHKLTQLMSSHSSPHHILLEIIH